MSFLSTILHRSHIIDRPSWTENHVPLEASGSPPGRCFVLVCIGFCLAGGHEDPFRHSEEKLFWRIPQRDGLFGDLGASLKAEEKRHRCYFWRVALVGRSGEEDALVERGATGEHGGDCGASTAALGRVRARKTGSK